MCGIFGFFGFRDDELLEKMGAAIRHRGPDQDGSFVDGQVSLGHRRLSIIDLSNNGRQPMANEDGSLRLVFNGEIYNFMALRRDLEAKGHIFKSNTDSEVILHAYEEKGDMCISDFQGMFAFAIWDSKKKRLLLCRDRIGKKPLYYWWSGGKLVFASEIKAIIQCRYIPREVNVDGYHSFLAFQYVPGFETAVRNVYRIPPAHTLALENNSISLTKYWSFDDITIGSRQGGEREIRAEMERLFSEAVESRLVSDVPLGVLLSGGLDSSSVTAIAAQKLKTPLKTFSVGFGEDNDELKYARMVSARFNTDHREFLVNMGNLMPILKKVVWHLDEPIADGGAFATFLVSGLVKDHVKVILVGEGADELFGGYSWHRLGNSYFNLVPVNLRKKLYFFLNTFYSRFGVLPDRYETFLEKFDRLNVAGADFPAKMLGFEVGNLLPDCLLMKVDKMTMAHSIEARAPFLDQKLLEFACGLPQKYKIRNGSGKYIIRAAMAGILPHEIIRRRKRGFIIPLKKWMDSGLRNYAIERLADRNAFWKGIADEKLLKRLVSPHRGFKKMECDNLLWRMLIFELWHGLYIKSVI